MTLRRRCRTRSARSATPTATRGGCSICVEQLATAAAQARANDDRCAIRRGTRSRRACAASTRAATRSTTRSRRCTSRCAAPTPDAALYWMCRMLDGGADPLYVGRRLVRMAIEDIGLADPRALRMALDAVRDLRATRHTGRRARARAGGVLPRDARRRAMRLMSAYKPRARSSCARTARVRCPMHLRNAPTRLMKELGYGKGYRYAHDEPDAYAAGERYLPDGMPDPTFYEPTPRTGSTHKRATRRAQRSGKEAEEKRGDSDLPLVA